MKTLIINTQLVTRLHKCVMKKGAIWTGIFMKPWLVTLLPEKRRALALLCKIANSLKIGKKLVRKCKKILKKKVLVRVQEKMQKVWSIVRKLSLKVVHAI